MDFRSITDPYIPSWVKAEVQASESLFDCDDGCGIPPEDDHHKEEEENRSANQEEEDAKLIANEENSNPTAEISSDERPAAEDSNLLWPVKPLESGEGLPYAPIDWPNPGDTWRWRVGRRYNVAGYFQDRFLYPPSELVPPGSPKLFASKAACQNFLKATFPNEDHKAFFASFSWKIPAKADDSVKVEENPPEVENPPEKVEEEPPRVSKRGRKLKNSNLVIDVEEDEEVGPRTVQSTPRRRRRAAASPSVANPKTAPPPKKPKVSARRSSRLLPSYTEEEQTQQQQKQREPDPIPADFDNYLSSIDDMLTQPTMMLSFSLPAPDMNVESYAPRPEIVKARAKLSALLAMDFGTLAANKMISQLVSLASSIKGDPTLSADQLVKLKLIDEIPLYSEVFMESKKMIDEVDRFFSVVEENKLKVSSMKNEYCELKEKTEELQAWVDSGVLAVKEIDDQIAQLKSRKAELTRRIEANKAAKVEVGMNQRMLASTLPGVVQEIQNSNSKIPEMEMKKINAQKREADVIEKFAPLRGFSF